MAGIEDVDELWSRLRVATDQAKSLAATNRELEARIASLERQLGQRGALSDDELLAQLPRRMGRALESAQEVAAELIGRAQHREEAIRQQTDQRCTALITHAEAEATAILRRAAGEAVARVNAAKSEAQAILRTAQSRHDQVMAELHQQSMALDDRVEQLRRQHGRLEQAYAVAGRSLEEARGALRESVEAAGPPPRSRSGAGTTLGPRSDAGPTSQSRSDAGPSPRSRSGAGPTSQSPSDATVPLRVVRGAVSDDARSPARSGSG